MIKINQSVFPSNEQWLISIKGMRNAMNSWEKSDTKIVFDPVEEEVELIFGKNDLELMQKLRNSGSSHRKFMRMLPVHLDITAPLYWWKEFDTYKVGSVGNSCSTMHKIQAKEFTLDDFSHEHLDKFEFEGDAWDCVFPLKIVIKSLNWARRVFLKTKNKDIWWQMIQLLPSSYNQTRTIMVNYENLHAMYLERRDHKQDEWREFCQWIRLNVPLCELITGEDLTRERA